MSVAQISASALDAADHDDALAATYSRPTIAGACVVDGFGGSLRVERGALEVTDGVGPHRRTRRYPKVGHGLNRVIVANVYGGAISFDAVRWLRAQRVALVVVDGSGGASLVETPKTLDDPRLIRQQALAPYEPVGLEIARRLLAAKVRGQARNLRERFGELTDADTLEMEAEAIEEAETVDQARQHESEAAQLYWATWEGHPAAVPTFVARDRARVPAHWVQFAGRGSLLHAKGQRKGNRKAERPVNAILNYAYALLENEAILACQALGLHPGLGITHRDEANRASLALDLIEPVRPIVERRVLDLLASREWRKADFAEDAEGHVRLMAPTTHELCEWLPDLARDLHPWAEMVRNALGDAMEGHFAASTPLTGARAKVAQRRVKIRTQQAAAKRRTGRPVGRPADPTSIGYEARLRGVSWHTVQRERALAPQKETAHAPALARPDGAQGPGSRTAPAPRSGRRDATHRQPDGRGPALV